MASAFLGRLLPLQAVDLIQRKKLDSRNFYESNLTEARFDSLPNNYGTPIGGSHAHLSGHVML